MNQETNIDYDDIDSYLREAQRDLTFAKGQEPGSSYEAVNLENAHNALKNTLSVLVRGMTHGTRLDKNGDLLPSNWEEIKAAGLGTTPMMSREDAAKSGLTLSEDPCACVYRAGNWCLLYKFIRNPE